MSKSKGNFLMMDQCVEDFSADATRLALADAGDTMDDANFAIDTANAAILALFVEEAWVQEMLQAKCVVCCLRLSFGVFPVPTRSFYSHPQI